MHSKPKLAISIVVFVVLLLVMLPDMLRGKASRSEEQLPIAQDQGEEAEAPADISSAVYLFATDNLNVRSGPGMDYEIIKVIPVGEKVQIIRRDGDWVNVTYREQTGYSHGDYLSEQLGDRSPKSEEASNMIVDKIKVVNGIILVNKDHSLPEDYNPGENPEARYRLDEMLAAAKKEIKKDMVAFSGYRSYGYQDKLYLSDLYNYGEEYADKYTAKPGHSEHQTGLAFDIGGDSRFWADPGFDDTEEAIWLSENAHRFGFILRYPEGKEDITGYGYESWHFRYVGEEHAKVIYDERLALEEYLFGN